MMTYFYIFIQSPQFPYSPSTQPQASSAHPTYAVGQSASVPPRQPRKLLDTSASGHPFVPSQTAAPHSLSQNSASYNVAAVEFVSLAAPSTPYDPRAPEFRPKFAANSLSKQPLTQPLTQQLESQPAVSDLPEPKKKISPDSQEFVCSTATQKAAVTTSASTTLKPASHSTTPPQPVTTPPHTLPVTIVSEPLQSPSPEIVSEKLETPIVLVRPIPVKQSEGPSQVRIFLKSHELADY